MKKYLDILCGQGAAEAKIIDSSTIVTAPWTIYRCQFGCDFFGKSFCCPPNVPSYKETQDIIDCYETGIMFNLKEVEYAQVTPMAVEVAREAFLDGFYKAIAFGSGPCGLCSECGLDHCRFPKKTVPSMEGCGIDVFQTARNNGFTIDTLRDRDDDHNYFGLVLLQ